MAAPPSVGAPFHEPDPAEASVLPKSKTDTAQPRSSPAPEPEKSSARIVLLGLPLSGKTSIQKAVFCKMPPEETRNLESTQTVERSAIANSDFVRFEIWDCPGMMDVAEPGFDADALFAGCSTMVFVIDAQSQPYTQALDSLIQAVATAYRTNPNINFQVLIHKVDGLSDDQKVGPSSLPCA